ncbi:MAG: serine/threonine-protein kinase, partial [Chloroflexota bacterium]
DFGEHEQQPYIVMQYLSGGTLEDRIKQGRISPRKLAPIVARIAEALDFAHERYIIHRDVKPANIIFDSNGKAYLSDFGIAVITEASSSHYLGGTPKYMSPEQAKALRDRTPVEADSRSDIYALGVVIFEALTGRVPYEGNTPRATVALHLTQPIPQIARFNDTLPRGFQDIIDKVLAKNPKDRYQTAKALADDLKDFATGRWFFHQIEDE